MDGFYLLIYGLHVNIYVLICKYQHVVWSGCVYSQLCLSLRPQEAETGFVPSVQDFDKKLAEADAYLQILIDQLKVGLHVETPVNPHFICDDSHLHKDVKYKDLPFKDPDVVLLKEVHVPRKWHLFHVKLWHDLPPYFLSYFSSTKQKLFKIKICGSTVIQHQTLYLKKQQNDVSGRKCKGVRRARCFPLHYLTPRPLYTLTFW